MKNLSTRGLEIIKILKTLNHPVSSLALSKEIGCSTKTIQSEIKDINKQLEDTKIVSIRGVGYQLEGKIDEEEYNKVLSMDRTHRQIYMGLKQRDKEISEALKEGFAEFREKFIIFNNYGKLSVQRC